MNGSGAVQPLTPLERGLGQARSKENSALYKRARVGEEIIRAILLFCGVVSIFTTIGIVIVLGRESLLFFGSEAWLPVKQLSVVEGGVTFDLSASLSTDDTFILTGKLENDVRATLAPNSYLKINDEIVLIVSRVENPEDPTNNGINIQRAQLDTVAAEHPAATTSHPMRERQIKTVAAMTTEDTTITLEEGDGLLFEVDERIQIAPSSEVMRITRVADNSLEVERAVGDIGAANHPADETIHYPKPVSWVEFFTGRQWQPQLGLFGIAPLVNATLMSSLIAMLVAFPLGLGAAIYLSEYASANLRNTLKPILEILAGVPTVVYGYFAIQFMTPLLRGLLGSNTVEIYNVASAGIVMGIMIIPTISSMSEDALHAVPRSLREASYGLGSTRLETTIRVVVPAALSGVLAALIVGVSRAVGETMIVAIAAGARPNFTFNPFVGAETMTGHIARISGGDLSYNSIDYTSIFIIGLTLFVITLILNLVSSWIVRRFREAY